MSGITKLMTAGGGGVALTPASSIASDVTVSVPSQNCTLGIQGPAFSAYQASAQSGIANLTFTKLNLQTEEFDTANCFDNATNYRFTPNVAGYYQVSGQALPSATSGGVSLLTIYKNGSRFKDGSGVPNQSGVATETSVSALIYMNGSTDYIELYFLQSTGSSMTLSTNPPSSNYFQAALVRAA